MVSLTCASSRALTAIHLATVACICVSSTAGRELPSEPSASSDSSPTVRPAKTSAGEVQVTASALTSGPSVTGRDLMTDILSFDQPGAFVQLYGFSDTDSSPSSSSTSSSKVGWSFEFWVKTDSMLAIILYATPMSEIIESGARQSTSKLESHFIAIEVINGKAALSISDGEGVLNVHSDIRISDGLWHHINAVFSPSHLELTVDRNSRTVKKANPGLSDRMSSSSHTLNHLNLSSIYLGGVDSIIEPVIIQQQIHTIFTIGLEDSSLVGCIREVKINRRVLEEKQIKLNSRFSKGTTCRWQFICAVESPCVAEAQCFQSGYNDFDCVCAETDCTRRDYVRHSSHESATSGIGGSRGKENAPHSTNQLDANEGVRGNTYVHSATFPGARGNLLGSSVRMQDETSQDATLTLGAKKVLQVSDLPAAGQSHIDAPSTVSAGPSKARGGGHESGAYPGHSSSFASSSVDPSSPPSASAPSFPESTHFSPNANTLLPHLPPTRHPAIDSMHINQFKSVGGFASDAFNLVISKEQFLVVTVIVALAIVVLLFSLVIRAFYLLGRKSKSRPCVKGDAPRNGSSSSSSCSSPAQLMKESENSCILPLTSTATGSTSVAGSSSGGTSSSPLPFGSDCGFDHLTHLDSAMNHSNFNSTNQTPLPLSLACAASANTLSSNGYGHMHPQASHANSHCGPHLTGSHLHGNNDQSDEMMHSHNLAMMMSRCSSSGSMASSPLPPPPDPVTTRSHFLSYAPGGNLFYKKQSDHIQLHAYPHSQHQLEHQRQRHRDCDTLAQCVPPDESSESSHLLMPAAGMNKGITSPLTVTTGESANITNSSLNECLTADGDTCNASSIGVTNGGNASANVSSYKNSQNGCSDHMSQVTGNLVSDTHVSLNYPDSQDNRHLARYSTYGTVSNKSPTGGIHSSPNYTTDDIIDAYATYSRVDKKREKTSSANESQKVPNHLQTTPHHQHRLSISSASPSSASSSSPYTPTTSGNVGDTIAITTGNRRDSSFIYPLPPPSLFFSRHQRANNSNNPSSPLLDAHDLTTTFKW